MLPIGTAKRNCLAFDAPLTHKGTRKYRGKALSGFLWSSGSPSLISSFPLKSLCLRLLGAVRAGDRVESQRKVSPFPRSHLGREGMMYLPVVVRVFLLLFCFVLSTCYQPRSSGKEDPELRKSLHQPGKDFQAFS